ncbi:rod shape-determining protein RodA [Candidatus Woesebacteria bacterium]|nr:rod shape-determining protein RodA [Candidatus Woesebacteria bacterium]
MNRWFLPSIISILAGMSLLFIQTLTPDLFIKHAIAIALGLGLFWIATRLPLKRIFEHPWWLIAGTIVFLMIPLLLPTKIRGTSRWIPVVGDFRLQPSQFAFVFVGIAMSRLLSQKNRLTQGTLQSSILQFATIAIPTALIAIEPDLGTALFFFASMAILLFLGGIPWKHLALFTVIGAVLSIFAWQFLLHPYQKQRVISFLYPAQAGQNETYNLRQSLIAIGAGGLTGSGIGAGTQSQLRYLPEKHTDFIFAAFSEEFGFIGSLSLVSLYLLTGLFFIKEVTTHENNLYRYYLTFAGMLFFFQAMVNIGTNTGLLPVTGMTLPFFSYGGTSFLTFGLTLGVAQNCISQPKRTPLLHIV